MNNSKKCYLETFRGKWFEFSPHFSHFALEYDLAGYFDPRPHIHICLGWGNLFVMLPFKSKYDECEPPRYGVYYFESCLWFPHGRKLKCIHLPWELDWIRTSVLRKDGVWETEDRKHRNKNFWKDEWLDVLWSETYPYTYTLKNGTIQERTATIKIEEREWRWRGLRWTKLTSKVRRCIEVSFSDEVGEKTGSWKGGCTGCGYDMLPNEVPLDTLRRMERDRKF